MPGYTPVRGTLCETTTYIHVLSKCEEGGLILFWFPCFAPMHIAPRGLMHTNGCPLVLVYCCGGESRILLLFTFCKASSRSSGHEVLLYLWVLHVDRSEAQTSLFFTVEECGR